MTTRTLGWWYFPAALLLAAWVMLHADWANELHARALTSRSPDAAGDLFLKRIGGVLSFGLYDGADDAEDQTAALAQAANRYDRLANIAAVVLAAISIAYLAVVWWRGRRTDRNGVIRALLGVATVCLPVGLIAPVLTLVAARDVPVLGNVVFTHESKAILGTISMLMHTGNYFLGGLLAAFSVLMPIVKMAFAFWLARPAASSERTRMHTWLHRLAPWSMTDVFVVALLIALFAARVDNNTDAWPGLGLYFFATYVLLSVLAGQIAPGEPAHHRGESQ